MSARTLVAVLVCLAAIWGGGAALAAEPPSTVESPPTTGPSGEEPIYTPLPNPDPERSILVLNVGWSGAGSFNSAPVDSTLLPTAVTNLSGPVNAWFRS